VWRTLLWIMVLAFVGGVILNFMPCVLPVLGVKLLVFSNKASLNKRLLLSDVGASILGIYVSFMLLAFGVIVLKGVGQSVGWGMHFQNPLFLSVMAVMLTLFIAHVWELFEWGLPLYIQKLPTQFMHSARAFFTGVFSVLLATPCTAPFVGTAVGFSLARHPFEIILIFSSLALGFAAPYWLILLTPSHRLRLPSPGPWLVYFRQFLSLLLLGTFLWLLFLLSFTYGAFAYVYGFLCAIGVWGGLKGRLKGYRLMGLLSLVSVLFLGAMPFVLPVKRTFYTREQTDLWRPFEPWKIENLLSKGYTVFLDVTAAWCVTCHVNKAMVLNRESVKRLLRERHVVCMRGDWTHKSPAISAFLKRAGQGGVPLNMIFTKQFPQGKLLPSLLSVNSFQTYWAEAHQVPLS